MGYMKIPNLYRPEAQDILMFKELFALEKVHGTSCSITFENNKVLFFAGGCSHESFVAIFNQEELINKFQSLDFKGKVVKVLGEGYGGSMQRMKETYGPNLSFIAFEVNIDDKWLSVPDAANIVEKLGLEFVPYTKISSDLKEIDAQRDADSVVAVRRGMGAGKMREGVVLRPLIELTKNNGSRFVAKHKRDEFRETKTPRPVVDSAKAQLLSDAEVIADEYVTRMRLNHILDKIPNHSIEKMSEIISAMVNDIYLECEGEFVDNEFVKKTMSRKTASLYKEYLKLV